MQTEIINKPLTLNLYGFGGTAANRDYAGTAFRLMGGIWPLVKANDLKHKGQNIWVYEPNHGVFAGIEFYTAPDAATGLEQKTITLAKYAYYKHIGPYNLIGEAGAMMRNQLKAAGFETALPYIEIYGHWNSDENKLETELLMMVR
jgi:hypothetical protein